MNDTPYRLISIGADAPPGLFDLSPVVAEAVAHAVGAGESPPTVIIRRQTPYALLGPKDARLPRLEQGLAVLQAAGLPVFERIAGGSAVILDEDCVSFAVAKPCRDLTSIHRNFRELSEGVIVALRELGAEATFGAAPGSFCEGGYDLVVNGLKVAGIAQALRRGFTLVSGMLLVNQDPVPVTKLLNRFYGAAGGEDDLIPDNVIHLSRLLGRPLTIEEVEAALRRGFAQVHGLKESELSAAEIAQARALIHGRRVA